MSTSRSCLALCALLTFQWPGALAASDNWTPFSPAGLSIGDLATDPSSPGTLYISPAVGHFKSTDSGRTWSWLSPGPENESLGSLVLDPSQPGKIYAVSGNGSWELVVSTDGGESWQSLGPLPRDDSGPFGAPGLVIGGTGTFYLRFDHTVFASLDHGGSWAQILDLKIPSIQSFAADPAGTLYVATGAIGGGIVIPAQIQKSADGGLTWKVIAEDILPPDLGQHLGLGTIFLAVAPTHPATVYAGLDGQGIFRSTDSGATWRRLPLDDANGLFGLTSLTLDPADPATLYVAYGRYSPASSRVYVSHDRGETWRSRSRALALIVRELAAAPGAGTLFASGTSGGLQVSTEGHAWQNLIRSPFDEGAFTSFTAEVRFRPDSPSTVYTLLAGQTWKSTDGGRTWAAFANAPGSPFLNDLAFDPGHPSLLYGASFTGIYRSGDGGASWIPLRGSAFNVLALPRPGTILAGGCGIGRSTDGGTTWRNVLPCQVDDLLRRDVSKMWVNPANRNEVYAVGFEYGQSLATRTIFRSPDGGATWRRLLRDTAVIALDPTRPGRLYAAQGDDLMRSSDNGKTWKRIGSFGFFFALDEVTDLAVDPASPAVLYATSRSSLPSSLLRSQDGGRSWEPVQTPSDLFAGLDTFLPHPSSPGLFYAVGLNGIHEVRLEP